MKKIAAITCAVLMMASLAGCGADYSNTTVIGQVTEIDGTKVTLQLGEMAEMELPEGMENMPGGEMGEMPEMPNGEMPEMPNGEMGEVPEMPGGESNGDIQWSTQEGGGMPAGEMGEMPQMPEGETGEMQDGFGGRGGMMQGEMANFTAGEETLTIDLKNVTISSGFGQMTTEGDISMVSEGSILVIEYGDNNTISSVTVQGGGNFGQMNMPKGN